MLQSIVMSRNEVAEILKCRKQTVQRQLQKQNNSNSFLGKQKTGIPKSLTVDMQNKLLTWVEKNRRRTTLKLKSIMQETFGVEVHKRAIKSFRGKRWIAK